LRALIEPAAVAEYGLKYVMKTSLINFRSRVIVQGCGPIDLMMIAIVRLVGVNNIIAIDDDTKWLATAQQMIAEC